MADQILPKGIYVPTPNLYQGFDMHFLSVHFLMRIEKIKIRDNLVLQIQCQSTSYACLLEKISEYTLKKKNSLFFLRILQSLSNKPIYEKLNNGKVLHKLKVKRVQIVSTGIQGQDDPWGRPTRGRCREHRGPMGSLHGLERTPKIKCKVLQKRNPFNLVHLDIPQSYLTINIFFFPQKT